MKLKKKGQITAFVFLGILVFIIFSILIYGASQIARIKLQEAAETQINDALYNQNIKNYVDRCVRDSTKDAILLIGKQGGYIYKEQGTSIKENPLIEEVEKSGIKENYTYILYLDNEQTSSPNYPCKFFPMYKCGSVLGREIPYCKFIHKSNNDKFCIFESEVLPELESTYYNKNIQGKEDKLLFLEDKLKNITIKKQLEEYITNRTYSCVNFTKVKRTFPLFEIKEGKIKTEVIIGKEQITAKVDYPIEVSFFGMQIKSNTIEFNTIEKNRLGEIVIFLNNVLLNKEKRNLDYDIYYDGLKDFENYFGESSGFELNLTKDIIPGVDLIKIKDSLFTLYGSPYIFRFLRENANPALDYFPLNGPHGEKYDLIITATQEDVPQKLLITPKARDVNEDNLIYKYHGWMAEFNQIYDIKKDNFIGCVLNSELNGCSSDWFFSEYFNTIKTEDIENNMWESSEEYYETKQNASIIINKESDLGPHNVTIVVSDEHGLIDWQTVRLFIDREIKAAFNPCNIYNLVYPEQTNFNCEDASIEDPYILDASPSIISLLGTEFNWIDDKEDWSNIGLVTHFCSLLPGFLECGTNIEDKTKEINILSISSLENNFNTPLSNPPHTVTLNLIAYGQTSSISHDIKVHTCLPFRFNEPPYPYNTNDHPYFTNHVCCNDNFNIEGTNKECYNRIAYSWYGGFEGFLDELDISFDEYPHSTTKEGFDNPKEKDKNSIFKVEMSRNCDGTRGNICVGDVKFKRDVYLPCQYNPRLLEQCSGPSATLKNDYFEINKQGKSEVEDYCVNYDGTTFEKIFEGGTGICNSTPKCEGDLLINNWTCGGNGKCDKPKNTEDCNTHDSYYGEVRNNLNYRNYTCGVIQDGNQGNLDLLSVDGNKIGCVFNEIDLDSNNFLCDKFDNNEVEWLNGACCGDDKNEYIKQTNTPNNKGCCKEDKCWNGDSCVGSGATQWFNNEQYICKLNENNFAYWEIENNNGNIN